MNDKWKTVRVFISSTFGDMYAERDYLVKRVFPTLRERLEQHRIHFIDIDLRWGVTKEQADNDKVLELCLEQIDKCRPFFIGILGSRYGWEPKTFTEHAKSRYTWIGEYAQKSVTELEIFHGVLRNHEMQTRSFFYFRDPTFESEIPDFKLNDVVSQGSAAEKLTRLKQTIRETNLPVFENYPCQYHGLQINWKLVAPELSEQDRQELETVARDRLIDNNEFRQLKPEHRALLGRQGMSVIYLKGLREFGQRVEQQLWEAICEEHGLNNTTTSLPEANADSLNEEADFHDRFMESLLVGYVGREPLRNDLFQFVDGEADVPCLVAGPSGLGKSAALARFVGTYGEHKPDVLVIPHFVGASPTSTNLRQMLRRFCRVLQHECNLPNDDLPDDVQQLTSVFHSTVASIPTDKRVVLVIDALNQLDDTDAARYLAWLPWKLPAHVKVITSATAASGTVAAAFASHEHHRLEIPPLTRDEQLEIVRCMPSLFAKSLDQHQTDELLSNPATVNPLFLSVALEELRGFGSFDHLVQRIQAFPRGDDALPQLFLQVIERLEAEFDTEAVRSILSLMVCARRGLSQRELLDLIEQPGIPTSDSQSDLFPVLRQLRAHLQMRGLLLTFLHQSLREAVEQQYLGEKTSRQQTHDRLAEYFASPIFKDHQSTYHSVGRLLPIEVADRQVDELLWHLKSAERWDALAMRLGDLEFQDRAWEMSPSDVRAYWHAIESHSDIDMVQTYRTFLIGPMITLAAAEGKLQEAVQGIAPDELQEILNRPLPEVGVWNLALLLMETGNLRESLALWDRIALESISNPRRAADAMNNRAIIHRKLGNTDLALSQLRGAKEIHKVAAPSGDEHRSQSNLGNQAAVLFDEGDVTGAIRLLKQQEEICRRLNIQEGLAKSLYNHARALVQSPKAAGFDRAFDMLKEQENISRQLGDLDLVQRSLGLQVVILRSRNDPFDTTPLKLLIEQEKICRQLGISEGLAICLGHLGEVTASLASDKALAYFEEQATICREIGRQDQLSRCLALQAATLKRLGDIHAALALFEEQSGLCRTLKDQRGERDACAELGKIYYEQGKFNQAIESFEREEELCRDLKDDELLQNCLGNQATIEQECGNVDSALELYEEQAELCRRLGKQEILQRILGHLGILLRNRGKLQQSFELFGERAPICRNLNDSLGEAQSLGLQAQLAEQLGRPQQAYELASACMALARQNGLRQIFREIQPLLDRLDGQ